MKKFLSLAGIYLGALVLLPSALAQTYHRLEPLSSFGPNFDGSIRPGDRVYVTTGNFQRGVSYNPATGSIIFIDRAAGGGGSPNISGGIYVLNGATGADVGTLNTNGMGGGDFADMAVGVSDDGAVYVGNVVNNGTLSPFRLYRWSSDSSVDPPQLVYSGDPGNGTAQRWGDTMDIRGSGTGTQIILGSRTSGTNVGTNVAILTTVDGINFTATRLLTDVGPNSFGGGIAFGAGNTFWAKDLDAPLRLLSFDLGTGVATTSRSYGSGALAANRTLEALAVDAANSLLAIVDFGALTDRVRLYDIADLDRGPVLQDIREFPVANVNGTTTKGYLDFGPGLLFVHSMNNGLLASSVNTAQMIPPVIAAQPANPGRVLSGRTVTLEVLAYPSATYQWQHNGGNIPNATNAALTLANVQTSDAGDYQVLVNNAAGSTPSSIIFLAVVNAADLFHLESLWSAAPGSQPYVTSTGGANTPNERGFAYNALSNQLCVIQRGGSASPNYTIHVIDAATGTKLYNLKTNGVFLVVQSEVGGANGIGLVAAGAGDDGAIYACNASPNAGGGSITFATNKLFRVYRWANSDSNTLPVQIFEGDPAGQSSNFRWGDVMHVRGSSLGTQILLDNQNASARYMAILRPSDAEMTNFPSQYYFQDTPAIPGTSIGRALQFGAGDTFWQKRKAAALVQSSFDPNAVFPNNISTVIATYGNYPAAIGQIVEDETRNLAVGISYAPANATVPDTLDLFDVSDQNSPLLLAQYPFQVTHQNNANVIGQVIISGDKVFALNGNNGMLAFRIVSGPQNPPTITGQPQDLSIVAGNSGTLSVLTADLATFQWQFNAVNIPGATSSSYIIPNATMSDAGPYRVLVSNDAGSTTSEVATVTVLAAEGFARLSPCWSVAPQSRPYLPPDTDGQGRTPLYRGIAYNGPSNQVYIISRTGQTVGLAVNVLDATTGADLYQLNTAGISGGTIILLAMGVAADGSLYAANMADGPNGGLIYNLYRWANSDSSTAPALVYSGDPGAALTPALRWGDSMAVRGSGTDTEILIDANSGTIAALFKPTDGTLSAFLPTAFAQSYGGGSIGRSLQFGAANTFWQKRKAARLQLSQYDLPAFNSAPLTNYPNFPASLGPVDLDLAQNLLAGINFSSSATMPDTLDLYDVSNFNQPQRIAGYNLPENSRPNGNFIGQVLFAGNKVYAVDGNNGIVAFSVIPPAGPPLEIVRSGSNVILSWPSPSAGFDLQKTPTLSLPDWMNVSGTPFVVDGRNTVTNDASSGTGFYRLRKAP